MFKRFFCKSLRFIGFSCFLAVLIASVTDLHLVRESQAVDDKDWQGNPMGVIDRHIRQMDMAREDAQIRSDLQQTPSRGNELEKHMGDISCPRHTGNLTKAILCGGCIDTVNEYKRSDPDSACEIAEACCCTIIHCPCSCMVGWFSGLTGGLLRCLCLPCTSQDMKKDLEKAVNCLDPKYYTVTGVLNVFC